MAITVINWAIAANGASVSASAGTAANAIDFPYDNDNDFTAWFTPIDIATTFLKVDLGQARLVNAIRILETQLPVVYNVESSTDNSSWTAQLTGISGDNADVTHSITPVTARYWRIVYTSGQGLNTLVWWFDVLGDTSQQYMQAQTGIKIIGNKFTQAQASILPHFGFFQAQAYIKATSNQFTQAQGSIFFSGGFFQAQARIKRTNRNFTQTQASIRFPGGLFQAQAKIIYRQTPVMQAMAYLSNRKWIFQAQAIIIVRGKQSMQAMASITNRKKSWQAQAYIASQRYLVKYNSYQLPGYVQEEAIDSSMNLQTMGSPFTDTGFSDYTGLENKLLSLTILVTGSTYLECKNQIQLAATELRSQPKTFAPLYVQNYSKHYNAWVKTVKLEADVKTNKSARYVIEFACKPWLYSDTQTTVSGLSLIQTTGRDIYDGGWTPINLRLSGTNITVSGHTSTGEFTGFLSVSGGVTGLSVDTEAYTVEMAGLNRTDLIQNDDFRMFVGPGVTNFTVTGATTCEISYNDRWYL